MFRSCPCVNAREAVFGLTFLVCTAVWSPVFLGADFGTLWAAFIRTPLDPPLAFAIWGIAVAGGLVVLVIGICENIADRHGAPVLSSLAAIAACAVAIHNQWYLPHTINPRMPYATEAIYIALIAACCCNLCMAYAARVRRLRLAAPMHSQPVRGPDETAGYRDAGPDAEHRRQIETLTAQLAGQRRDADVADARQLAAENRDMKAVLAFPGVRAALLHTLHSDHHAGANESERRSRDEIFLKLTAIYRRIGERGDAAER